MSTGCHARARIARAPLSEQSMARVMRRVLPARNYEPPINYGELLAEARDFGVRTRSQFRALMLRHRRALIAADREPLTPQLERMYRREWGDAFVSDRLRRQFWWSWEGLTRLAFEFEFGDKYDEYKRTRQKV
jgi:hypothetical protein